MGTGVSTESSSSDLVYAELRRRFADGELAPGERLKELDLAKELSVSRTPVREALVRLEADRLVVPAARGFVVAALSRDEIEHIYEVRATLEGLAAAHAARSQAAGMVAPVTLRAVQDAADAVEHAVDAGDAKHAARANMAFHRAFAGISDNPFLDDALHRLWDRIAVSTVSNLSDSDWARTVIDQHRRICEAITAGDENAARHAAEDHIHAAMRAYRTAR